MKHIGAGLDHTQACPYCPKYIKEADNCKMYPYEFEVSWINRRGGCPYFPERDMPAWKGRVGQQKQKHNDRTYHSKNDGKRRYF